jgi:hypothetical protein
MQIYSKIFNQRCPAGGQGGKFAAERPGLIFMMMGKGKTGVLRPPFKSV